MADLSGIAAQCGARMLSSGVGFDAHSWERFIGIVGPMLPDATNHERVRHADAGGIDLYYEKPPTPKAYEYLARFCQFQATAGVSVPPPSASDALPNKGGA